MLWPVLFICISPLRYTACWAFDTHIKFLYFPRIFYSMWTYSVGEETSRFQGPIWTTRFGIYSPVSFRRAGHFRNNVVRWWGVSQRLCVIFIGRGWSIFLFVIKQQRTTSWGFPSLCWTDAGIWEVRGSMPTNRWLRGTPLPDVVLNVQWGIHKSCTGDASWQTSFCLSFVEKRSFVYMIDTPDNIRGSIETLFMFWVPLVPLDFSTSW